MDSYIERIHRNSLATGREEGLEVGRDTLRKIILETLEIRFGKTSSELREQLGEISDTQSLKQLHRVAMTCEQLNQFPPKVDQAKKKLFRASEYMTPYQSSKERRAHDDGQRLGYRVCQDAVRELIVQVLKVRFGEDVSEITRQLYDLGDENFLMKLHRLALTCERFEDFVIDLSSY